MEFAKKIKVHSNYVDYRYSFFCNENKTINFGIKNCTIYARKLLLAAEVHLKIGFKQSIDMYLTQVFKKRRTKIVLFILFF